MAIAYVNSASPIVNGSGTSAAFAAASLTAGNLITVAIRWSGSVTISSITDTAGNTYSQAVTQNLAAGTDLSLWRAENVSGNANNVVTLNFSGSASAVYAVTAQYSGVATASPLDVTANAVATATSVTSSAFTTNQANEVIVSAVGVLSGNGTTLTPSGTSGTYTTRTMSNVGVDICGIADIIVSTTQSGATATWTSTASDTIGICVGTFKDAAGGGGRTTKNTRAFPLGTEIGMGWVLPTEV